MKEPKQFKPRARSQRNKLVQLFQFIATNAAGIEAVSTVAPGIAPPGTGAAVAFLAGVVGMGINQFWPK
jgi:hypothetical protein